MILFKEPVSALPRAGGCMPGSSATTQRKESSMAKTMTKAQTVTYLSDKLSLTRKVVAAFLE